MDVHVRGIDPEVWTALRMEAVRLNVSMAKLIEQLWLHNLVAIQSESRKR